MKSVINFIKYHNAFTIGLGLVLFLAAGAFASEDAREAVIGEKVENVQGIDNSQILAADLDNFNFQLIIKEVEEDAGNYYLSYDYQTLAIQENAWRGVLKNNFLTVSKARLGDKDMGLYAQGELGEILDRELRYLREVQAIERANGATQLTFSTDYTGLVGLVLDMKDRMFPGYEPVVQPQELSEIFGSPTSVLTPGDLTPGVDEGTPGVGGPVNGANRPCSTEVGACQIGVQIYQDGAWGDCIGAVFPTDEILDLVDNNCDGQVDEGLITPGVDEGTPGVDATATSTEPIIIEIPPETSTTTSTSTTP